MGGKGRLTFVRAKLYCVAKGWRGYVHSGYLVKCGKTPMKNNGNGRRGEEEEGSSSDSASPLPGSTEKDASEAEDIAWMLRAKDDDLGAFSKLVKKHQKSVMNFFARNGVYRDVEDLAQETFLKLHRARQGYRPTAKFTTFLYLIARQVMIDSIRHGGRKAKVLEGYGQEAEQAEDAPTMRGESEDAEAALGSLSPPLREAVVLVVMQGMAYGEAAEILGVPVGTVKSRISAAMEKMREAIRDKRHSPRGHKTSP